MEALNKTKIKNTKHIPHVPIYMHRHTNTHTRTRINTKALTYKHKSTHIFIPVKRHKRDRCVRAKMSSLINYFDFNLNIFCTTKSANYLQASLLAYGPPDERRLQHQKHCKCVADLTPHSSQEL